ncbi:MAG: RraA family protein [Acidobacteria bacterium]|nr:RraA family protein [Acidobacteriota bacterium]
MRRHTVAGSLLTLLAASPGAAQSSGGPAGPSADADVRAPEGFRANRTTYSAIMDVLGSARDGAAVTDADLARLREMQLEDIWSALGGYRANYVRGFRSTQPGERIAGRALTMRFLPPRPDFVEAIDTLAAEGDWDRRYYARAAEEAQPGDVVVAELGGAGGHVLFGGMGALGIKLRGAAGVVIDGGSRDLAELASDAFRGFPVFARFFDVKTTSWLGAAWNAPVRIGTATVLPGDVVVADDTGVLFFPAALVPAVLAAAAERAALEEHERNLLRSREYRFRDVYPLSPELREEYERRTRDR